MPVVLPGKPEAKLQAVSTGRWDGRRIIAYISGNALILLDGPNDILQTIYHEGNESLQAVAFHPESGKVATCRRSKIYIHAPDDPSRGRLKWLQQACIVLDDVIDLATLSWGGVHELLSGSSSLHLFAASPAPSLIWKQRLANPAKLALVSHDAALIASTGNYDKLVKIWRRLAFDVEDTRFDFAYLAHPATVTGIRWQESPRPERPFGHVLYTVCDDKTIRVWAASDPRCLQILELSLMIDLQESIKPRWLESSNVSTKRYAFLIDHSDFTLALRDAIEKTKSTGDENHILQHQIEVANRDPDVCVILDEAGRMSAWGLNPAGAKLHKLSPIFNIAHVDGPRLTFSPGSQAQEHVCILSFCDSTTDYRLTFLVHHFDGRIEWLEAHMDLFFDPARASQCVSKKATWSGHRAPIKKFTRSVSGSAVLSRTDTNECILWKQKLGKHRSRLDMHSQLEVQCTVQKSCVLSEADLVILLHDDSISVWDTTGSASTRLASHSFELQGQLLCLILLPTATDPREAFHVACISKGMKGIVWEVARPSGLPQTGATSPDVLSEFCQFDLGTERDITVMIPVDPAGSLPAMPGTLDVFARDVAISFDGAGTLKSWTAQVDMNRRRVNWLVTSTIETGFAIPSLASGSSIRKAALVDEQKTNLTIWDTREAQLEYEEFFKEAVQDLDWTSTPDNQSVLAVGFSHHVLLLSQLRYDYLEGGPAWGVIRTIQLEDLAPHSIEDSVWLSHGDLVVGAGNQLFVFDRKIEVRGYLATELRLVAHHPSSSTLFHVVSRLNGQLPVFHPQFLSQCILCGKPRVVQRILHALQRRLIYLSDGDELETFLGLPLEDFFALDEEPISSTPAIPSPHASLPENAVDGDGFTELIATSLNQELTQKKVPQLSSREQLNLADMVECVSTAETHRRSLDENGARFLVFFRQQMLRKSRRGVDVAGVSWREVVWAFHSGSQEILVDLVSRHFQGRVSWAQARDSGMLMWLKSNTAVKTQFEIIARNQYTKADEKNPIDCSLYYLALKKKTVLLGLWRMAGWHPEQRSTQKFLSNNFQEARWKTAALKNAYALLGRHRYEYATSFFLLADALKDAVNTCINQLDDLQLGITIARVYEGDDGPVLKSLLQDRVLPLAVATGNRWLATWAFWMQNRRDLAVRALVSPLPCLVDNVGSPSTQAKLFLADDPALVVLYRQLRERTLQTLRGSSKVSPRDEWDFVMHTARLYDRMGCDLLALDLVSNWEFLHHKSSSAEPVDAIPDPRTLLRRRSSLVVADIPSPKFSTQLRAGGTKPPMAAFVEPEANSLLNSFGF